MGTIGSLLASLFSLLFGLLWWILSTLLWALVWVLLPLAIVAFIALRIAEKALGPAVVRGWIKTQALRFGLGTWQRARRLLFALGVMPLRVLAWFAIYTVRHAIISLFWRPKWSPWQRAWAKRWKPGSGAASPARKPAAKKVPAAEAPKPTVGR